MTAVSHPPYFSLFPWLKIKLKGHHLDTTEVIEAELQAALNTLTEHGFQDGFKNCRSSGNGAYSRKGTTSRAILASRRKVNFWLHGSASPGNFGWLFVFCSYRDWNSDPLPIQPLAITVLKLFRTYCHTDWVLPRNIL
jgi:hypothetical protein